MKKLAGLTLGPEGLLQRAESSWSRVRTVRYRYYRVAGLKVKVFYQAGSPVETWLESLVEGGPGAADFVIKAWTEQDSFPDISSRREARGDCPALSSGKVRVTQCGESASLCLHQEKLAYCWLNNACAKSQHEIAAPFRTAFHSFLESRGWQLVHAAALARRGKAALFIGRGGAGKSHLCSQLSKELDYLGDDYVAIRQGQVRAVYRSLKLNQEIQQLNVANGSPTISACLFLDNKQGDLPIRSQATRALAASTLLLLPWADSGDLRRIHQATKGLSTFSIGRRPSIEKVRAILQTSI